MERATESKLVLIVRKTRLDDLVVRFNTVDQARFYVEHLGADFTDYLEEDRVYKDALRSAQQCLADLGRLQVVDRAFVPNFIFGPDDTVVVLGQDGLVANVLKYLTVQPVIGVNPDPERWEGVLLPFGLSGLKKAVLETLAGLRGVRKVTMAKAVLNTGQVLYGVNDLFIGPKSHTSARYTLRFDAQDEYQSSSGIIVSTGLGSSGWLRSIFAGATGIASQLAGKNIRTRGDATFPWDADYLYFTVREPWPSMTSSADVAFGKITPTTPLVVVSHMPENGVIFSDGIEKDFVDFNAGTQVTITMADKTGRLVV